MPLTDDQTEVFARDWAAHIIRTLADLETLDPDTLVMSRKGYLAHAEDNMRIPVVVVATGERVRAAEQALERAARQAQEEA